MSFRKTLLGCFPSKSTEKASNIKDDLTLKGVNRLAMVLSKEILLKQTGNVIFSPLSMMSALAIALMGSSGKNYEEIKDVLNLSRDSESDAPIEFISTFIKEIIAQKGDSTFVSKNKVLFEHTSEIKSEYAEELKSKFDVDVDSCDFKGNSESETERTNAWLSQTTNGKIKNAVSTNELKEATHEILMSAMYFKSDWLLAFDQNNTARKPFYLHNGTTREVTMMYSDMKTSYATLPDLKCSAIRLKLNNCRLKVMFVLPDAYDGLPDLLDRLFVCRKSAENFAKLLAHGSFANASLEVSLPKFSIQHNMQLKDTLSQLGMKAAFQSTCTEFNAISDSSSFHINEVIHTAGFEIEEKGAEKAAATAESRMYASNPPIKCSLPEFKADHPFLFVLLSAEDDVVFLGRMSDPSQSAAV